MAVDRVWLPRAAAVIAVAVAIAGVAYHFDRLTGPQEPRTFYDTAAYFQIAERPVSVELFELAKPPTVPLVFRAAERDPATIDRVQRVLSLAAWLVLAASAVLVLRRAGARVAAAVVLLGMALAPARVGWTAVMLSESLDDSLLALAVALALGLASAARLGPLRIGIARSALTVALVATTIAWVFARDTNALAVIAAAACAVALWWPSVRTGGARWALGPVVLVLLAAVLDLTAARATPDTPLPFQAGWMPALTSRAAFPAVDDVLVRGMADADARAFFADRGLPVAQAEPFSHPLRNDDFVHADPTRADAQAWIAEHGTATYASWLVRHPLDRLGEIAGARGTLVAPDVHRYMPTGWIASDADHPALELVRRLTASRWVILAMCLVAPFTLRASRLRADPRAGLALCLIAGGVVAALASYYGDAVEADRHCYGASQLLVLGLVLALACGLDRLLAARLDRGIVLRGAKRLEPGDAPRSRATHEA